VSRETGFSMFIFQDKILSQEDEALLNRLVIRISKKYSYPNSMEIKDLQQAAEMALIKVRKKYDPEKGKLFSYAYTAIERAIQREIKEAKGKILTVSLDKNLGEDNFTLHDVMEDKNNDQDEFIKNLQNSELRMALKKILSGLLPRDAKIISLRFGLEDGCPKTLEEIGSVFKVTRERIRQIEARALNRIRKPARNNRLKTFLE
jgi:RNA polymerase sigma factor (sigma-70 family)